MKWKNSLVFRIGVAINILVLTGVLTISAVYLWRETNHLEEKLKDEAITAANTLNSAIGLYMLEGDYAKISPTHLLITIRAKYCLCHCKR